MESISHVYIFWTIHGMWMIYITFERGGPKFSNTTGWMLKRRRNARRTAVADSVFMNPRPQEILCCIVAILLWSDAAARLCGKRYSCGIWKFRTSFKCYVDHSNTMYSSGNIDVWNWVHLFKSPYISWREREIHKICLRTRWWKPLMPRVRGWGVARSAAETLCWMIHRLTSYFYVLL